MNALSRSAEGVRRHGVGGYAARVGERLAGAVHAQTEHVWYVLDLHAEREVRPLEEGLRLATGRDELLPWIERLPTIATATAKRWLAEGARPWLVLDGDEPAFACWIFGDRFELAAGTFRLPAQTALLEASVTSAACRGRGIAPAAWDEIGRRLAAEGIDTLLTLVPVENAPSRRAVAKAGFVETARVHRRSVGRWQRVTVTGSGDVADELRLQLAG
jgi:L-amino acid N-acyltransferase YncA